MFLPLAALLALTPEAPADAVFETVDPEYEACISGLGADPEAARRRAETWLSAGGGPAALHCQAMGDLAAGYPGLAAFRLEELAARADAGDALVRARILSQAALAWIEAEHPQNAAKAIDRALELVPEGGELRLVEAQALVANQQHQAAIAAVDAAAADGYESAAGFVARARARIALADYRRAAEDVVAALRIEPLNIDALTLRGDLFQRGVFIEAQYSRPDE